MSHFYERNSAGEIIPRHFVPMSSRPGESRPTRLTDARKNRWVPSVTTIQGLLDKPALTSWKIDEHLKQAWNRAYRTDAMNYEDWAKQVKADTESHLEKAPKDGTDFHDVLETYFKAKTAAQTITMSVEDLQKCKAVDDCLHVNAVMQVWKSEQSFVHPMGFAGKVDIHSKALNGNSEGWVCDFKTKNTSDKWKPGKMAYTEMAMQLAAYRVGLGLDNARCANVFICLETGEVEFYEWSEETLNRQWANFADLLRIWLRNADYIPRTI